jgi:hypothetical protein
VSIIQFPNYVQNVRLLLKKISQGVCLEKLKLLKQMVEVMCKMDIQRGDVNTSKYILRMIENNLTKQKSLSLPRFQGQWRLRLRGWHHMTSTNMSFWEDKNKLFSADYDTELEQIWKEKLASKISEVLIG